VKRGGPLRRGTPLQRRQPLRTRIREPYELRKAKKIVKERSGGRCEARIPSVCTGRAMDAHHVKMRSRGGKHDASNLLHLCRRCHQWIDDNPRSATQMGLLKHSWEDG
jgi:predicted restriction endonuclease